MDTKTIAWVSYITFIGWIVAFVLYNNSAQKSSLATFHIRQSFGIMVSWFVVHFALRMFAFATFGLGFVLIPAVAIVFFVLWILGLLSAVNGEEKPVPVLGTLYQKWFSFIN